MTFDFRGDLSRSRARATREGSAPAASRCRPSVAPASSRMTTSSPQRPHSASMTSPGSFSLGSRVVTQNATDSTGSRGVLVSVNRGGWAGLSRRPAVRLTGASGSYTRGGDGGLREVLVCAREGDRPTPTIGMTALSGTTIKERQPVRGCV